MQAHNFNKSLIRSKSIVFKLWQLDGEATSASLAGTQNSLYLFFVKGAFEGYHPVAVKVDNALLFRAVAVQIAFVAIHLLDARV